MSPGCNILLVACQLLLFNLRCGSQNIPEAGNQQLIPDLEGDILFLTDSSGSVSYYEFAKVKEFMVSLLRPFYIGPNDVQVSIVHISTIPTLEFPFNKYTSNRALLHAVENLKQIMGDTNTGRALQYAKDTIFTDATGSRASVPKVLVWVTDGISTDDILEPMNLLKDSGVHVFIVSTGRGNYVELSQAASHPPENHLHFVDVDDLPIILQELRNSIINVIRTRRLRAYSITSTSFRLQWPPLFAAGTGYYVLEYYSAAAPHGKVTQNLLSNQTSFEVSNLQPGTTYEVTLIPESNVAFTTPQKITVTTLKDIITDESLKAYNITSTGFRLQWSPLFSAGAGYYVLEYYSAAAPHRKVTQTLSGDQMSFKVSDLHPGTTYEVTLIPESKVAFTPPQKITVTTLKDVTPRLKAYNITSTGFRLQWSPLFSAGAGYYVLEYYSAAAPHRKVTQHLSEDQMSFEVSDLHPGTTYEVTLIPESNVPFTPPQKITVTTFQDEVTPAEILISESKPHSFKVSWSPTPDSVSLYQILYSPLPRGSAMSVIVSGSQNTTVLENLQPNTTYLVTVIAQYKSGLEKALSAKACTLKASDPARYQPEKQICQQGQNC